MVDSRLRINALSANAAAPNRRVSSMDCREKTSMRRNWRPRNCHWVASASNNRDRHLVEAIVQSAATLELQDTIAVSLLNRPDRGIDNSTAHCSPAIRPAYMRTYYCLTETADFRSGGDEQASFTSYASPPPTSVRFFRLSWTLRSSATCRPPITHRRRGRSTVAAPMPRMEEMSASASPPSSRP